MPEATEMETVVVDSSNKEVSRVTLPDAFASKVSEPLMFEQVLSQRANRRAGTAATKTRGMLRGGGSKPWRQKGSGRARAGSSRSPLWRGGGTIFGPSPRSYAYRLPRAARRAALRSALSQKRREGQITVVDSIKLEQPKTKQMRQILDDIGAGGSALVVIAERNSAVELSARNLPYTKVLTAAVLNVEDVLRHDSLVIEQGALPMIEERVSS